MRIDSQTELVTMPMIAGRLGISRQWVHELAHSTGFPPPVGRLGRIRVWRWSSIERWARGTGRL